MYASSAHRLFKIISFSTQNAQEEEDGINLPEFYTKTSAKGLVLVCKVEPLLGMWQGEVHQDPQCTIG